MAGNARIRITAEDRTRAAVATARRNFQNLGKAVSGVTTAIGLSTAGMGIYLAQQAKVMTENKKFAEQLNISTQRLNELAYAFGVEGNINAEQFADSLQGLNSRLGEAAVTGGGPLVEAFQALGLSIKEVRSLDTDEMILEISKAFEKLDDAQKETFLSAELFEGEAEKLITLLRKGPQAIQALTDEYRNLAGVISEEEAEKIGDMTKAWGDMTIALDGLANTILVLTSGEITPWINDITEALTKFSSWVKGNEEVFQFLLGMTPFTGFSTYREAIDGATDSIYENATAFQVWLIDAKLAAGQSEEITKKLIAEKNAILGLAEARRQALDPGETLTTVTSPDSGTVAPTNQVDLTSAKQAMFDAELAAMQEYWDAFNNQSQVAADQFEERWGSTLETFSSGVGSAVADAIVDQSSLGDALQATMRQVAKEVISSLIRIGVQRAVQAALGQGQMAATTAAGVAQGAALTAAFTPAAIAANIASFGGAALAAAASAPVAASSTIAAVSSGNLAGIAHDGLDYVPQTGTYLLEKGERVVKKEDNKAMMSGGMGNTYNFTIHAMDTQTGVEFLMKNENTIVDMVQQKYDQRGETGGPMR